MTQVDHESVQATAAKNIFDLLHLYGLEAFRAQGKASVDGSEADTESVATSLAAGDEEEEPEDGHNDTDENSLDKATQKIINLLAQFLDQEVNTY